MEERFWVADCDGQWRVVRSFELPDGAVYGPFSSRQSAEKQVEYWRRRDEKLQEIADLVMRGWVGFVIFGLVYFCVLELLGK